VKQSDNFPSIVRRSPRGAAAHAGVCLVLALPLLAHGAAPVEPSVAGSAVTPNAAAATRPQSLSAIARRAEDAIREALPQAQPDDAPGASALARPQHRITARELDPRLRLAACPTRLEAALPTTLGGLRARNIVQIRCTAPASRWTVLVPVALETDTSVLVAARSLNRGQVPGAADLQVTRRVLPGISTVYISNLTEIRAQHLVRPVEAGQPLTRDALAADPVVRRGEAVTLVADVAGVEVRMPGRALADAQSGQPVRAQNVNSLKIVEGRADDEGMVRVDR
jgi:flagellar basal body P-ring formation protein FlgA